VQESQPGMFNNLGPDNSIVVQAFKTCAAMYGYKDADNIAKFVQIAKDEMREEMAEMDKVN